MQSNERKRRPWDKIIALATAGVFALTVLCVSLVVTLGNTRTAEAAVVTDVWNALFRADGTLNPQIAFNILRETEIRANNHTNGSNEDFRLFPSVGDGHTLALSQLRFRLVREFDGRIAMWATAPYRESRFTYEETFEDAARENPYYWAYSTSYVRSNLLADFSVIQSALPNVNNAIAPKGQTIPDYNIENDRVWLPSGILMLSAGQAPPTSELGGIAGIGGSGAWRLASNAWGTAPSTPGSSWIRTTFRLRPPGGEFNFYNQFINNSATGLGGHSTALVVSRGIRPALYLSRQALEEVAGQYRNITVNTISNPAFSIRLSGTLYGVGGQLNTLNNATGLSARLMRIQDGAQFIFNSTNVAQMVTRITINGVQIPITPHFNETVPIQTLPTTQFTARFSDSSRRTVELSLINIQPSFADQLTVRAYGEPYERFRYRDYRIQIGDSTVELPLGGHSISAIPRPTRAGYVFRGWALLDGGEVIWPDTECTVIYVDGDMRIFPVWVRN